MAKSAMQTETTSYEAQNVWRGYHRKASFIHDALRHVRPSMCDASSYLRHLCQLSTWWTSACSILGASCNLKLRGTLNYCSCLRNACLAAMTEQLHLRGTLRGHNGWVTQITSNPKFPDTLLSSSRDKTLILWKLTRDDTNYGIPKKRFKGHGHFVTDVVMSCDGQYALSSSWDKTLRLWDLAVGTTARRFEGHEKDVLSAAFSADNRQIVSGSRDKTIKLWNTLAECKYTIKDNQHEDWVSCVRFSPTPGDPTVVSCGWDWKVKVWNLSKCRMRAEYSHTGYLNTVTVSPDGTLCASGGKDCKANLWDMEKSELKCSRDNQDIINALCYSPSRYWLCVATGPAIKIWNLEDNTQVDELCPEVLTPSAKTELPQCISLAWSADGQTLFAGYTDSLIRVWQVSVAVTH